ncbi:hypothetical protein ACWIGI_36005 [Nocardia sp. NPDC055321]
MGITAQQSRSTASTIRVRARAATIIVLTFAAVAVATLSALAFAFDKLTDMATDGPGWVHVSYSESDARGELARLFDIHIPDNWQMEEFKSSCYVGSALNTCRYHGSFAGPADEFGMYPSIFQARRVGSSDPQGAEPVTCDGLAAKHLLPTLMAGLDCSTQQRLVLSQLTSAGDLRGTGYVLIASSSTTTTVRLSIGL